MELKKLKDSATNLAGGIVKTAIDTPQKAKDSLTKVVDKSTEKISQVMDICFELRKNCYICMVFQRLMSLKKGKNLIRRP